MDLFFVLSGFLITGILWRTRERAGYFLNFYARRTLRTFPLYYIFVGLTLAVFFLIARDYSEQVAITRTHSLWIWLYAINILLAIKGEWAQAVPGFNHLWSLAVEEQFYLCWPVVIHLVSTYRKMVMIAVGLILLAPLIRSGIWFAVKSPLSMYVLMPTRMDSLACGAFVFLITERGVCLYWARKCSPFILALSAIAVALVFINWGTEPENPVVAIVGFSALAIMFGAVIILAISSPPSALQAICNKRFLRLVGKYSYAIYILHPSVRRVVVDKLGKHMDCFTILGSDLLKQLIIIAIGFGATFAAAKASWVLLEVHFLKLKRFFRYRKEVLKSPMVDARTTLQPTVIDGSQSN